MQRRNAGSWRATLHTLGALACALPWLGGAGVARADAQDETSGASQTAALSAPKSVAPFRLDRVLLAGIGLEEYPPLPKSMVLAGGRGHRGKIFFRSDQIVVELWEGDAGTLSIPDPTPYDEYVQILSGKLILTDGQGARTEYSAGESLVIPAGFKGTWQMQGNFRELVVIERKAYDRAEANE